MKQVLAILILYPLILSLVVVILNLLVFLIFKSGIIVLFIFAAICVMVTILFNIPELRKFQRRMAEIPDDYIPEILTRYMIDQPIASQGDAANDHKK